MTFHSMSSDQVQVVKKRIDELSGGSIMDRIVAILMRPDVGGTGLYEDVAITKAAAIINVIEFGEMPLPEVQHE